MTDSEHHAEPVDVRSIMDGAFVKQAPGRTEQAETWKPIPGYPAYEVSEITGRVRSVAREAHGRTYRSVVLATRVSNSGYELVGLRNAKGERETRTVHTLVLLAFVGPCPPGQEARHLNGDPLDNRLENLAWGTKEENEQDKFAHGRPRAAPNTATRAAAATSA